MTHRRHHGSFQIAGVPPGNYNLLAWHPGGDEWKGKVTVAAGAHVPVRATHANTAIS